MHIKGKVLTFDLDGHLVGIDITAVKEINRNIEYTPVSDAPAHIVGLFNMRGQIVTLFNLAGLMGYETERSSGHLTCIILKNTPDNPDYFGFLIGSPGSVVDITEEMCTSPPANLNITQSQYVEEVVKLENDLLMIINRDFLLEK
ncbi:MAG: chemotaxis protein CheW [Bacillota bacterium]